MSHRLTAQLSKDILAAFQQQYPASQGWRPPSTAHAQFDLLLMRKNGMVTEKIIGFWMGIPPTPETDLRSHNLAIRNASGRYSRIHEKFLILPASSIPPTSLNGFKVWPLVGW